MKKLLIIALFMLVAPAVAMAAPTADEAKKVQDHYYQGSEPVLVDYKFCTEVAKAGDNKNECVAEVDPMAIAKDTKVLLWMNYMVPLDTTHNISVLVTRNDRPMRNQTLSISQGMRYRTWVLLSTGKDGDYKVQIDKEVDDNYTTLKALTYKVME